MFSASKTLYVISHSYRGLEWVSSSSQAETLPLETPKLGVEQDWGESFKSETQNNEESLL